MLLSLHIENVAVIRCADIDFTSGLCVLTGETGAGKSLLIDSINLLTGSRVSRELIRTGEDKALISAVFSIDDAVKAALEELGIEAEEDIMLQRTLRRDGKSEARINGRAVTQSILKDVGGLLINIHGQSDNQKLMQAASHKALLDNYAQDDELLQAYVGEYHRWKKVCEKIEHLRHHVAERLRLKEMLEYQIKDIDGAKLKAGEEERLLERRDRLQHLEKIERQTRLALRVLTDSEKATVVGLIDRAEGAVSQLVGIIPESEALMERLNALRSEAEDISECIRSFCDEDMADPTAELDRIEGRLDAISRLGRKYGESVEAILAFREDAANRLHEIDVADDLIDELTAEEAVLSQSLAVKAEALTKIRTAAASELSNAVQDVLAFLDMPKVRFQVAVTPADGYVSDGKDSVEFMIATNQGEPLQPMIRIASGGELSRIMLAVRSVLNLRYGVSTTIYDEVDTGISGRTARKVGIKLAELSKNTQVICVTHSAQIASLAETHYMIEKQELDGRAETSVRRLTITEQVEEIARILGGLDVTDVQREAARELISERSIL